MPKNELPPPPDMPNFAPRLTGIALVILCLIAGGLWLVQSYSEADEARDLQVWQEKLDILAENRAADVDHWLANRFKVLHDMANNPSLQLYLSALESPDDAASGGELPQKTYLRNLLLFTAQHAGFVTPAPTSNIAANLPPQHANALAIIDGKGTIIAGTPMTPATQDLMIAEAKQAPAAKETLIDITRDKDGTLYMGFVVPVFSIQGDHTAGSQVARVVGIQAVDGNLFGLLQSSALPDKSLETILVRREGGKVQYLSPLIDGTTPLAREESNNAALASAALVGTPGQFISSLRDYRGRIVLATSRAITGAPWTLITKVDRSDALAAGAQRRGGMEVIFMLVIAVIVFIIAAIWWRASSRRALLSSAYFQHLAAKTAAQERLLRLVTDHQPEAIYIVDAKHTVRFANRQAEYEANMGEGSFAGKPLADVRGAARAAKINDYCDRALTSRQIFYDVLRVKTGSGERVIRSAYVPVDHIPLASLPSPSPGVLVVDQDVSDLVHEREKRLEILHQLVRVLLKLVDARDPFAANHSLLVSQIAQEVAIEMELDNTLVETARIAGSLMNIGKIVVPKALLTKTGKLTAEEKRAIRDSMNAAADLLEGMAFDGPVVATLKQWQEQWNGKGPLKMKGEEILITARIIAATNAFVGMVSPRSWRTAIAIEEANKFLLEQAGEHFDRKVVIALINYIENHNGKAWLKKILEAQKSA